MTVRDVSHLNTTGQKLKTVSWDTSLFIRGDRKVLFNTNKGLELYLQITTPEYSLLLKLEIAVKLSICPFSTLSELGRDQEAIKSRRLNKRPLHELLGSSSKTRTIHSPA